MALNNKIKGPVFLKEDSQTENQLAQLRQLEPLLTKEGQDIIKQDIRYLEYGIIGEKNIAFELENSHMPMYVLHDVYLEDEALSAQIDYIVISKKICFVIESKNLYGNIEINKAGDFIRTMEFGGKKRKEGIYSPITQNQRHLDLLKRLRIGRHKNKLKRFMVDKFFEDGNKSIVVLANPKTIVNTKFAKKEDKDKVIRADQLVTYIKKAYKDSKELELSDAQLLKRAESYLALHKEVPKDYTNKYKQYLIEADLKEKGILHEGVQEQDNQDQDITQTPIYQELREYRLEKSREEKIKPYVIFSNKQLEALVMARPKIIEDLYKVPGFGDKRVSSYGEEILSVIKKYRS